MFIGTGCRQEVPGVDKAHVRIFQVLPHPSLCFGCFIVLQFHVLSCARRHLLTIAHESPKYVACLISYVCCWTIGHMSYALSNVSVRYELAQCVV
jgi:hypothetical protein